MKHSKGFTLIELLLVVSAIGVISGIAISVIDPQQKKKEAQDSVKLSTLKNLTEGIEAYRVVEGEYPVGSPSSDPYKDEDSNPTIRTYLRKWPGDEYIYIVNGDQNEYSVYVAKEADTNEYYKYYSGWGKIQQCTANNIQNLSECENAKDVFVD